MRVSCFCALFPWLSVSPVAGQWAPATPVYSWSDTSKDNDPTYRSLFVSLQWKQEVRMLNLRVPRSGAGECHLSSVGVALAPDPSTRTSLVAPLPTMSPNGHAVTETQPADLDDVAPTFLGTLSTKDGTIFLNSKFVTGIPQGIIIVNPQGIFAIPLSRLSRASLRLVKDRAPATG